MNLFALHPIHLYVVLPSLFRESSLSRIMELYRWKDALEFCGILTTVCSSDSLESLRRMQNCFFGCFDVYSDPESQMAEKLKCLHEKPVFGKKGRVIHPSLFLESDGRIVLTLRQIRRPAILRLVRRAVKLQSRWVCENLESLIDTRQLP